MVSSVLVDFFMFVFVLFLFCCCCFWLVCLFLFVFCLGFLPEEWYVSGEALLMDLLSYFLTQPLPKTGIIIKTYMIPPCCLKN